MWLVASAPGIQEVERTAELELMGWGYMACYEVGWIVVKTTAIMSNMLLPHKNICSYEP